MDIQPRLHNEKETRETVELMHLLQVTRTLLTGGEAGLDDL